MPTTPTFGWRTPAPTDPDDVPTDLASLASQIETTLLAGDSGWIALTLKSGFSHGPARAEARVLDGVLYLRGRAACSAGNLPAGGTDFATLPAGITLPGTEAAFVGLGPTAAAPMRGAIQTNGTLSIVAPLVGAANYVMLTGAIPVP